MTSLKFFNNTPTVLRSLLGFSFILFSLYALYGLFLKAHADPLLITVGISIALWGVFFSLYVTLSINIFYLDPVYQNLINSRGTVLWRKNNVYPYSCIKSVELRKSSTINDMSTSTSYNSASRFYGVLILEDDEIYLEGSTDKEETQGHVKELAKGLKKTYKENFNAKNKSKKSEINIFRTLFLLVMALIGMAGIFKMLLMFSSI